VDVSSIQTGATNSIETFVKAARESIAQLQNAGVLATGEDAQASAGAIIMNDGFIDLVIKRAGVLPDKHAEFRAEYAKVTGYKLVEAEANTGLAGYQKLNPPTIW